MKSVTPLPWRARRLSIALLAALLCGAYGAVAPSSRSITAQDAAISAKLGPGPRYTPVKPDVLEKDLRAAPPANADREGALQAMFEDAGCGRPALVEQLVKSVRWPNLICTLPGQTPAEFIVGAHFDKVDKGGGVVDNWSGASLLPAIYAAFRDSHLRHRLVLIGFTGEEEGLLGSKYYVKNLTDDEAKTIRVMINMDTLALGPTKIWLTHSDQALANRLNAVAHWQNLPLAVMNADGAGEDDSESFIHRRIPTLMLHSLTRPTLGVLHTRRDNYSAVDLPEYQNSYRLVIAALADFDQSLP